MVNRLNEDEQLTQRQIEDGIRVLRAIGKRANRFGFNCDYSEQDDNGMYHIVISKRNYPNVIVEWYAKNLYDEALVRVDISNLIKERRYSYGEGKMTLNNSREFRNALTTSIELATTIEALFDSTI